MRWIALALFACSCSGAEDDMVVRRNPPWLMWGNTQTYDIIQGGSSPGTTASGGGQLAKVAYGRPETWNFFFSANVMNGTADNWTLDVYFDVVLGVGRANIKVPGFEHYHMQTPGYTYGTLIWSTMVQSPHRIQGVTTDVVNVDHIVAQDIQVNARIVFSTAVPGQRVSLQLDSYWSPAVHVRPEWWHESFPGGEDQTL